MVKAKKGQVWSFDTLIAASVLAFILLFCLLIWNTLAIRAEKSMEYREMRQAALHASDSLALTPGEPAGWHKMSELSESNLQSLGLASTRNKLDYNKIQQFASLNSTNYTVFKKTLGLSKYDYSLTITDINKTNAYYSTGINAYANSTKASITRLVVLNGSEALLNLEVWKT